jgi:membrane protease YdiL (CAAX protease family)
MDDAAEPGFSGETEPELPVLELAARRSRPWLTILLSLCVAAAYVVGQGIVAFAFMMQAKLQNPKLDPEKWMEQAQTNGTLIALCLIAATIISAPLTIVLGRLVHDDAAAEVLGLRWPGAGSILRWTLAILAFAAATDALTWLTGREIVPPFMREAYASARWPALLWLAIVVAAPISEELLFRGLLFGGLVNSRLGFVGTALFTAVCFAAMHVQYDAWAIGIIFFGGLLLAAARQSTGSIVPCMAMHAAMNFMATCEAAFLTDPQ